jgi:hypothetical protein
MLEVLKDVPDDEYSVGRRYCIGSIASIEQLPSIIRSAPRHFLLFLAVDATDIQNEELGTVAKALLQAGMVYLCAWGPDCERVHDLFDEERDPDEVDNRIVMTTWHSKESLFDALSFFVNRAFPADGFQADSFSWIAISVGNKEWESEIRANLVSNL